MLTRAVEENQQRDSVLRPGQVHLQCLRCRSEFALKQQGKDNGAAGGGEVRRRGSGMLAEHDNEQGGEELLMTEHRDDKKGGEGRQSPNPTHYCAFSLNVCVGSQSIRSSYPKIVTSRATG